jgi:hypothetical protein
MCIKPYVSPLFDVTGNARHRPLADQHPPPLRASKLTDAAQWRVDIKGICGHTLADSARIFVEQFAATIPKPAATKPATRRARPSSQPPPTTRTTAGRLR